MSKKHKEIWDDTDTGTDAPVDDVQEADYPVICVHYRLDVSSMIPARPANAKDARVIASHPGREVGMIIDKAAGQKRYYVEADKGWDCVAIYDTVKGEWI
jgi:hypothetical protein